jgi:hypothetical protein
MNRLSGRVARVMLSPGVGPTVPFATIERSMPDRLLLLVFSLRIPAGEPDFLARADQ